MSRCLQMIALAALVAVLWPAAAWAQYPSETVGFNGFGPDDFGDPAGDQEMFRLPEFSPTTTNYVLHNTAPGTFDHNAAYREAGYQSEGAAGLRVWFDWANPMDLEAWVRLTTFSGPVRPNPSLHTQGKIRFKLTNVSELWFGTVGVCIGVRETGIEVPQMKDGGTTGEIEWVGVDTTPNGIVVGDNWIVDTDAVGDDVQVYPQGTDIGPNGLNLPSGTAVITPGNNGVLDTAPAGDDKVRFGYYLNASGERRPIPAIALPPTGWPVALEWNLTNGHVSIDGVDQGGGITGFTGNGQFDKTPYRGTLEQIVVANLADGAQRIDVTIDELQFESPVPDPVLPPRVKSPIINGDTQITVTDLQYSVDQVKLLRSHAVWQTKDVTSTNDVVFDFPPGQWAQTGEVYTAIQVVDGTPSAESAPVTVLPYPPFFSFSIVIDEDGDDCGYNAPGGWEFVPVTALDRDPIQNPVPRGLDLFNDDAVWQTVDVPIDNTAPVKPWLGGNGVIDPSPTGVYSIDSVWFSIAAGATSGGPHEVFIDGVEALDANGQVIMTLHNMENGINYLQYPRGQSNTSPTTSALSTLASYDGLTSHRLVWTYADTSSWRQLAMYHNIGYACGTSPTFPDSTKTVRFHLLCRSASTNPVPLPTVVAPIVGAQTSIRVMNDSTATAVQLFINGTAVGNPKPPTTNTYTDFTGLTLVAGDSISAKQTTPLGTSDFAYPRVLNAKPLPPVVQSPIAPGATAVTVNSVYYVPYAQASNVTVYVNGQPKGSATPAGSSVNVTLTVTLVTGDVVQATQTVNGATSDLSPPITVAFGAPVIYKAPAQDAAAVRVQGFIAEATTVVVVRNGTTTFTAPIPPGAHYVDVPVSGLVMGDTVTAKQRVGDVDGVESPAETVTTNQVTIVFADNFEYDEATYLATWQDSVAPRPLLSTDKNSTIGGAKSVLVPAGVAGSTGAGRIQHGLANLSPTATVPVVWNVNVYDRYGPGASNVQFAQLNGQVADFYYQHVGMLSWSPQDTNYYQYRANSNGGPNWVDLKGLDAPQRWYGWHNFTVVHKGRLIDVYVDGLLCAKNITLTADTTYDMCRIGPGYNSDGSAYYDDYVVQTGPVDFSVLLPYPPKVVSPVQEGDPVVTIGNIKRDATRLTVYANGGQIGFVNLTPPNFQATVDVPVTALVFRNMITATQTTAVGLSEVSPGLEVGQGNGDLLACIGIRETNDPGPLGSQGGTTGQIEWIGATGINNGAPLGQPLPVSGTWRMFLFDPLAGPIVGFPNSGDGVITATRGVLEHLAVTVDTNAGNRSSGPYDLYADDVVNVGAGNGGADFLITDFEGYPLHTEVLFQEPTYSGTTSGNLSYPPSASETSNVFAHAGAQAEVLAWFFKDTTAGRWARVTTSGASNISRPIIDLTKPIRLWLLLPPPGPAPCRGDMNCDGLIDFGDIDPFVAVLSGGTCCDPTNYNCDVNGDGSIDFGDIDPFVALLSSGATCP